MKNQSPNRQEIFLALALGQAERRNAASDLSLLENAKTESPDENIEDKFPAIFHHLSEAEAGKFDSLWSDYQKKTAAEKNDWRVQTLAKIGGDDQLIDEQVHPSHINEVLHREIPAVQKIIARFLPPSYRKSTVTFTGKSRRKSGTAELIPNAGAETAALKNPARSLEKAVSRAFAKQFVALRDLENPTAFDRLNGAQLARLIRLTGIREVATACVRIEAVESVAAFLRIFSAEDAQAIAAQLNSLSKISEARAAFAEHLVQTTLETEPQPSAMLDLLGIWLIGVLLCHESDLRVRYTNQKLPLEIAPKLPEIIREQCEQTPEELKRKISREIERLAETLFRGEADKKSVRAKKSD